MHRHLYTLVRTLGSLAVVLALAAAASAVTYTWNGGGSDANWSTAANWDVGAPVSDSTTTVTFTGAVGLSSTQNIADPFVLNRLEFLTSATTESAFTVNGDQLQFVDDGTTSPRIYLTRRATCVVNNDIDIASGTTLYMEIGTYGVTLNGLITGDGGIEKLANAGGLSLTHADNTFSGGLTIRAVDNNWYKVNVYASGAMGTGDVNLYGGTLGTSYANPGGLIFYNTTTQANQINLHQDSPIFAAMPTGTNANVTLTGPVDLNGNTLYLRGGGTGSISGNVVSTGGGGSIRKTDSGTWTLSGANTFAGTVTIDQGVLKMGSTTALASASGVTVNDGGTFDFNGFKVPQTYTIAGTGSSGQGALINTGGDVADYKVSVVLAADASIGGTGRFDIGWGGGTLDGGGYTLTKTGSNYVDVRGTASNLAGIVVDSGYLYFETSQSQLASSPITVNSGGVLGAYGSQSNNAPIVLNGGTLGQFGGGSGSTGTWSGDVTVNTTSTLSTKASTLWSGGNLALTGDVSGAGGLTIEGPYTVTLSGTNSYAGTTTVDSGILKLGSTGAVAGTSEIIVNSGGTFDFNNVKAYKSITIAGTGSSGQGALINSGSYSPNDTFTLTLSDDASIGGVGRFDIGLGGNTIEGNNHTLTKIGSNYVAIRGAVNNLTALNIDQGYVYFETNESTMGSTTINVASGAAVGVYGNQTINAPVVLTDATLAQYGNGSTGTWSGTVTLAGTTTFNTKPTGWPGGNIAVTGQLLGSGNLVITGPNTVTLSGAGSTATGTTLVQSGSTLVWGADDVLPSGSVTVQSGATVDLGAMTDNNTGVNSRSYVIAGSGTSGQGALIKTSGASQYGNRAVNGLTLTADATVNTGVRIDIGGAINLGTYTLTKIGSNVLPFRAAVNNPDATLVLNAGGSYIEANNMTLDSIVINNGTAFGIYAYNGSAGRTVTADITINGSGTIYHGSNGHPSTPNTYEGTILVNGGTATLRTIGLNNNASDVAFNSVISGTGTIVLQGTDLNGGVNYGIQFNAANTFSGDVRMINYGAFGIGNADALQFATLDTSTATASSTLDFTTLTAATFGGLKGTTGFALENASSAAVALSVGNNDLDTTFSGALTGAGSLTKIGDGVLTLTGDSTYVGGTTVQSGSLLVNGSIAGPVSVNGGLLGGNGTIAGSVTVGVAGTHAPGNSPDVQTVMGDYTVDGTLAVEILGTSPGDGTTGYDQVLVTSTGSDLYDVTLNTSTSILDVDFSGLSGSTPASMMWIIQNDTDGTLDGYFSNYVTSGMSIGVYDSRKWYIHYGADASTGALTGGNDVLLTAVPEPTTLAMLAGLAGFALLGWLRRRRQQG